MSDRLKEILKILKEANEQWDNWDAKKQSDIVRRLLELFAMCPDNECSEAFKKLQGSGKVFNFFIEEWANFIIEKGEWR